MKKILIALAFGIASLTAYAEASFDQIQTLIEQKQYSAAEKGLEVIIQNHPKSAKAFYAMAQAQAGLGNLEKAQKALDIATGLNPTLDFAPASAVASLKQAITPQTAKIEAVEESHALRNFVLFAMFAGFSVAMYFLFSVYARKKQEEAEAEFKKQPTEPTDQAVKQKQQWQDMVAKQEAERREAEIAARAYTPRPAYRGTTQTVEPAYREPVSSRTVTPAPQPTTTVVNNNSSSSSDLLTGVIIGNMMGSHHHDTTRVVEREVVREVPAPKRDSSWDDTPSTSSSKSSSWDDTPSKSSSRSSSWDDSSSSSSSSSWSSSSDSSSSSSWSSSDSSSSSSWD